MLWDLKNRKEQIRKEQMLKSLKELFVQCELIGTPTRESPRGDGRQATRWLPVLFAKIHTHVWLQDGKDKTWNEWYVLTAGVTDYLGNLVREEPDILDQQFSLTAPTEQESCS